MPFPATAAVGVFENPVAHADFANIMQQAAQPDAFNSFGGQVDPLCQTTGINGNSLTVLPGIGIFNFQNSRDR